jgi:uncharacterized protein
MSMMDKLRADLLTARKERSDMTGLLTALVGEAAMIGKNNGNRETTDEEVLRIVKKFRDNAVELMGHVDSGTDAETKAQAEIARLEAYMPKQMSEDDLRKVLLAFKATNPAAKIGDIMAYLKTNFAGTYDARVASQIAKEV